MSILKYLNIDSEGYKIDFESYFHKKGIIDYTIDNVRYLSHNSIANNFLDQINEYLHPVLSKYFNEQLNTLIITNYDAKELNKEIFNFGIGPIGINRNSEPKELLIIENKYFRKIITKNNILEILILHEKKHIDLNFSTEEINSKLNEIPSQLVYSLKNIIEDIWINKSIKKDHNLNLEDYFNIKHDKIYINKIKNQIDLIAVLNYFATSVLSNRFNLDIISLFISKDEIENNSKFRLICNILNNVFDLKPNKENLIRSIKDIYSTIDKNNLF